MILDMQRIAGIAMLCSGAERVKAARHAMLCIADGMAKRGYGVDEIKAECNAFVVAMNQLAALESQEIH